MPPILHPATAELPSNRIQHDVHASAVSWGAIFAGAAGASALSLILLILGTGLGMSSVSPWATAGISATTFGVTTIAWVTITQWLASGMGGYLAGRLRTRWTAVHADEVYFRDTAHGFLAWAVASLATAALLTSVIGSILGTGAQAGASLLGGATGAGTVAAAAGASGQGSSGAQDPQAYFVDALFRKDANAATPTVGATEAPVVVPTRVEGATASVEVARVYANGLQLGALPVDDVRYLGQLVAQRTGLSQADAERRVNDNFAKTQARLREAESKAKEAADKARKASAYAALWLFISLLGGAFVASLMATYGGRRRDA